MTQYKADDFIHIHLHTEYSLLDGQSRIPMVMKRAKDLGMPSVAITDHGVMFGVMDFHDEAVKNGIKPILGMEAYLARRGMQDRDPNQDKRPFHLLLLAKNMQGYLNLMKLASEAQLNGYYYRPRIDRELLSQYSEGIIATSGCLAAEIPRMVGEGKEKEAMDKIGWYQDIFGEDNFFLEIQPHDIKDLITLNKWLVNYRKKNHTKIQLAATNDVHYVNLEDVDPHDTLLCIQTHSLKNQNDRMRLDPMGSYYMKSAQDMRRELRDLPEDFVNEALWNTLRISEMCDVNLKDKKYHIPDYVLPEPYSLEKDGNKHYLRHLVEKGMNWRFQFDWRSDEVLTERLNRELEIINNMGFNNYFLIVWDLCQYALNKDIWWNVRGSGAGSLVAYCLGITSIDPIKNKLIFERFLNPGRVSMPDIDIDYQDDRRDEMIAYAVRRYGKDRVSAIITFGTMAAKGAIKDVGRALGVDLDKVNYISAHIPQEAKPRSIKEYVEMSPELSELNKKDPESQKLFQTAETLQGITRHASTHAAGIIIADKPLTNYAPLHRITGTDPSNGFLEAVLQFPMETAEHIGLLKVDFLGLSTLTVLRRACALIEKYHNIKYSLGSIPYYHDDPSLTDKDIKMLDAAFELISRGETIGVFQLESPGMQSMLRGMQPFKFEHIVAGVALYRPGPMDFIPQYNARMHGDEEIVYLHPKMVEILEETYGIIVYQESLMQIATNLFGYSPAAADDMRRAVSKKKDDDLKKHRQIFVDNGPKNGVDVEVANKIFDAVDFFANYGFNKCVSGETTVFDVKTKKTYSIKDIVDNKRPITVKSIDSNMTTVYKNISNWFNNGIMPVFKITTALGKTIRATANHPFLVKDKGWKALMNITHNDRIAIYAPLKEGEIHGEDVAWEKIKSIKYDGSETVYDIEVPDTHNFVANGIIIHNSHASDYAMVAVKTAFLKTHYPHEYMAALLSVHLNSSDKVATYLEDCRRMKISVLPPDINESVFDFDIQSNKDKSNSYIRFGLGAIKNAGKNALEQIIQERNKSGRFRSLSDICTRLNLKSDVGKRAMESLIKSGSLDSMGDRDDMLYSLSEIIAKSGKDSMARASGQLNMFAFTGQIAEQSVQLKPSPQKTTKNERLAWEKEILGIYVSGRPVDQYKHILRNFDLAIISELHNVSSEEVRNMDGTSIMVAGEIVRKKEIITKKGDPMLFLDIEDWYDTGGIINTIVFPKTYQRMKEKDEHLLDEGKIVIVRGKFSLTRSRGDEKTDMPQIIADDFIGNIDKHHDDWN